MKNDTLLLNSLYEFYDNNYNSKKLLSLLDNEKKISLRSIDWFTTNFSKKNNIYYSIYHDNDKNPTFDSSGNKMYDNVNIFHSYKSQLKAYSKKSFDPFCRRDRIIFPLLNNEIETTIGQLNFFRWAINNLILDYIELNKDLIETDMNDSLKLMKINHNKKNGERKKRQELSLSATRGLTMNNITIELNFN